MQRMPRLQRLFALIALTASLGLLGCGSEEPEPAGPPTAAEQAEIDRHDAAVEAAESQR